MAENTDAVVLLGTAMVAQELVHYVPQPLKIRRTQSIAGVSPSAITLVAVMSAVWFAFAIWEKAWAAAASGAVVMGLAAWTVIEVARHGANLARMARVALGSITVVITVTAAAWVFGFESAGLSVLLLTATVAHGVPRLVVGLTAPSLRGLSATYLALNICDGALYGAYGALINVPTYMAFALVQVATSAPVLLRWMMRPELRGNAPPATAPAFT
jgi:uncharacterized protein with PQ loop repeat